MSRTVVLIASVVVILALGGAQQNKAQAPVDPRTKFVNEWFGIYKAALSDLTTTRGSWGTNDKGERVWIEPQFGMSRIPRILGHDVSTGTEFLGDRKKLGALLSEGAYYGQAWGYGAGTTVLTTETMRNHFRQYSFAVDVPHVETPDSKKLDEFARTSLAKLQKEEIPTMKLGDWDLQARLMRLTDEACLRCHVDNQLNDPVAVFVFATRPK